MSQSRHETSQRCETVPAQQLRLRRLQLIEQLRQFHIAQAMNLQLRFQFDCLTAKHRLVTV